MRNSSPQTILMIYLRLRLIISWGLIKHACAAFIVMNVQFFWRKKKWTFSTQMCDIINTHTYTECHDVRLQLTASTFPQIRKFSSVFGCIPHMRIYMRIQYFVLLHIWALTHFNANTRRVSRTFIRINVCTHFGVNLFSSVFLLFFCFVIKIHHFPFSLIGAYCGIFLCLALSLGRPIIPTIHHSIHSATKLAIFKRANYNIHRKTCFTL